MVVSPFFDLTAEFPDGYPHPACPLQVSRTAAGQIDTPNKLNCGQAGNFYDRPDFHRAIAPSRNLPCDFDGLIEVPGVDQEVAAKLLAGLREGAVGHKPLAIAGTDAGR